MLLDEVVSISIAQRRLTRLAISISKVCRQATTACSRGKKSRWAHGRIPTSFVHLKTEAKLFISAKAEQPILSCESFHRKCRLPAPTPRRAFDVPVVFAHSRCPPDSPSEIY